MRKILIIIVSILVSFSAFAKFNKKCNLKNRSYISPSLGGCIFQTNSSGKIVFKINNKIVNIDKCLSLFLKGKELDDFKNKIFDMEKDFNVTNKKVPILYVSEKNGGYLGKLTNETLGIGSFAIPFMKKGFSGNAKISLDNGLNIYLKIKENAKLSLVGSFGKITMTGPCEKIK